LPSCDGAAATWSSTVVKSISEAAATITKPIAACTADRMSMTSSARKTSAVAAST
jgi:hypothetical protein